MKLLRHPPLAGWLTVLCLLAGVIGWSLANQDPEALEALHRPNERVAVATVDALRGRIQNAYRLIPGDGGYRRWATVLERDARAAARARQNEGARRGDALVAEYRRLANIAGQYADTGRNDRDDRAQLAGRLAASGDRLATLAFPGAPERAKGGRDANNGGDVDSYTNPPAAPPVRDLPALPGR